MKKFFFLIAMLLCTAGIFAQDTTTAEKTVVAKEINSVVNNTFDRAEEAITKLAVALKVPAERVYTVLVKQQVVVSTTNLVIDILVIILIIITLRVAIYGTQPYKPDSCRTRFYESEGLQVVFAFLIALSIVGLVYSLFTLNETVSGLVNPEYGAMKEVTKMLQSL